MIAAVLDDLLYPIILVKLTDLADELDRESVVVGDLLRMGADFITKPVRPLWNENVVTI